MSSADCKHCVNLKERIISKVANGKFGKVVAKCQVCGTTWMAQRDTIADEINAVLIDAPEPRQHRPEPRQAFVNDPRRRGPQ